MIRINLLAVDRSKTKKKSGAAPLLAGNRLAIGCGLILVLAAGLIGFRFWTLGRQSAALDVSIAAAQLETERLHSLILQVQQFEQRKAQLQQRVVLIEQLRSGQTGPVHMLDQISRALPPMLWLTELKQDPKSDNDVLIDGRSTTLTGLSDFVANLEASGYFKRSIEIVTTTTETVPAPAGELIRFQIKAQFQQLGPPKPLRQTQLVALKRDIATGQATARKLPEFRGQVAELEGRLDNLKAILPAEKDAADLLRRMQTVAIQSHLTIKGFRPAPTVTKQLHAEWPINLDLDGTYHNLAIFLDRVGRFTRIVNISGVDVKGKDKPDPNSTITASCVATTFVLLEKPGVVKPGTPPAKGN